MTDDELIPYEDASASRQTTRLAEVPELYRQAHERLAVELALHMDDAANVFARYHYTVEEAADLCESPAFITLLQRVTEEVRTNGLSFRMRAKAISEDLLPHAYDMATDPLCSSAVRADLIKWAARVAGNEPKEKDESKTGGGLTLSITFAGQAPQQVVSAHETLTIEGN